MGTNSLAGRKQSQEHIVRRIEAVRKARASWSDEKRRAFAEKISAAIKARPKELQKRFMYSNIGRQSWCKGKKIPQISGQNHWNWGNKMPQESIEKMRRSLIGKKQSPEVIKKRFAWADGYKHSLETKKKIGLANSGEGNGNWLGGASREPYALIWGSRLFKNGIKERDNHTCQNPECKKNCNILTCHHIDYDKKYCDERNLITLCRACNGRANFNRYFWEVGYKEIIRLKYETNDQQIAI